MHTKSVASIGANGREDQLQFLRFLAFINIFICHAEQWLFFRYPASHCANAAVSFFFMLSGLVAGYTMIRHEPNCSVKAIGTFMYKKLRKLYPLYLFTVILAVMYSGLPTVIGSEGFMAAGEDLKQLLKSLLLVQSWFEESYFSYNGVGWFLSSVMFLYLLTIPIMAVLHKVNAHPKRYFLFVGMTGALGFLTICYCYFTQHMTMTYWHYIFPPARMGEYMIGMIMGVVLSSVKPGLQPGTLLKIALTVLEIFVLVFWFRSLSSPGNYWRNHIVSWLIPNMMLLGVFTIGGGWISALFRLRPLVVLGDLSFGCYLIHQIVITLYSRLIVAAEATDGSKMTAFIFCFVASVLLAICWEHKDKKKKAAC